MTLGKLSAHLKYQKKDIVSTGIYSKFHGLFLFLQCHQLHQYVFMKSVNGQNGMMGVYKPLATMGEILKLLMSYERKVMQSVKPQGLLNAEQKSSLIYH